ncbi:MAG: LysM peptidoglycan-binding domain-containing protein [Chloroflexota bacterium]
MKRSFLPSTAIVWRYLIASLTLSLPLLAAGCVRPDPEVNAVTPGPVMVEETSQGVEAAPTPTRFLPPTAIVQRSRTPLPTYQGTPTPDPTRSEAGPGSEGYGSHTVAVGETLGYIAQIYGTTVEELVQLNDLANSDILDVDQVLRVPDAAAQTGPSFKIIPDSELVYGPALRGFDSAAVVAEYGGYLLSYSSEVEGRNLTGTQIVQLVADRQSVSPRLLLALIEYLTGWVTHPSSATTDFALGYTKTGYENLYQQLTWAANLLNLGYYGRSEGGLSTFQVGNDRRLSFAADINDGTAGLQLFFGAISEANYDKWLADVGPDGVFAAYSHLFGNPFAYTVEPLVPDDLVQPALKLPWAPGETWYLTGGPHGAWASGSAWAALDFAPPHDQLGCYQSDAWVTAMADGVVTRSDAGAVVTDLDGDGFAGTGWSITYMHVEARDRVPVGSIVQTGDALGHPSCEGGFSNGTHVHIARAYNGRWISADGLTPFTMSGWLCQGLGREYDGLLIKGDQVKEACECREEGNAIRAD